MYDYESLTSERGTESRKGKKIKMHEWTMDEK